MKFDELCLRHVHGQTKRMRVLNKAVKIVRKNLIVRDEIVDGDI